MSGAQESVAARESAEGGPTRRSRWTKRAFALTVLSGAIAACSDVSSGSDEAVVTEGELNGGAPTPPTFESLGVRCKLINGRNLDDPTPNLTHFRANIRGTDLGIPVAHGSDLYFFFGDTAGFAGIWPLAAESAPDAVGVAPYSAVKNDPNRLCSDLRFIGGLPEHSVGRSIDPRVERDFAIGWMRPPPGHDISEFVHNPVGPRGANAFPNAPGDFEVPSGAFSYGGSIYLFYTTVESPWNIEMQGSYLARWSAPSPNTFPEYDILYTLDHRFGGQRGSLRGDFINVAPVVVGDYVYMFGTGEFRKSGVNLARKRLSTLDTPGGIERFDAASRKWRWWPGALGEPIVKSTGMGEISVRYFASLNRFVMLDQEFLPTGENVVLARFAKKPEGPWTDGVRVASLGTPELQSRFCCVAESCDGERMMNCDRAGYYATYMLPDVQKTADGHFSIDFLVSTWDPYNVALMTARFAESAIAQDAPPKQ